MNLKRWLCSLMLASVSIAPVFPETNSVVESKNDPVAVASNAAGPAATPASSNPSASTSPSLTPSATHPVINANITMLLNALITKGVLAPSEANAIRNAAPEAELQLLVAVLGRKGVLSAADLPAPAASAVQPSVVVGAPAAVTEAVSTSLASP